MLMLVYFILLIILLSVGFGVSYWLLIEADKQDDTLGIIGKVLGWILIVITLIVASVNIYYSAKMIKNFYVKEEIREEMQEQIQEQRNPQIIEKKDKEEVQEQKNTPTANKEAKEEAQEELQEHKIAPETHD